MDHTPQLPQDLREHDTSGSDEEYGPKIPVNIKKKVSGLLQSKVLESDSPSTYGPALPLHMQKNNTQLKKDEEDDADTYGPSLPPHLLRAPTVSGDSGHTTLASVCVGSNASTGARLQGGGNDNESNLSDSDEYGPSLPPHLKCNASSQPCKQVLPSAASEDRGLKSGKTSERTYGPELPPQIMAATAGSDEEEEEDSYCPDLPPHLKMKQLPHSNFQSNIRVEDQSATKVMDDQESSGDDEVYGPMPPTQEVNMDDYITSTLQQRTEATQRRLKDAGNAAPKREDWMLTLPEDRPLFSGLGLQARQFSKSGKRDRGDTSVWTDTPADKELKAKRAAEGRAPEKKCQAVEERTSARDERLQAAVDHHNDTKRSRPLIETHQSKQKKAKQDGLSITGVGVDRKPFSREEDLHVNKFDEAQKSSILKKARNLNDRFSSSKSSKFL